MQIVDRHTGKSPLFKIAFDSLDLKIEVLRSKRVLKSSAVYKNVYLYGSKTHTERILELNAKMLLAELHYGRIVKKYPSHQNGSGGNPGKNSSRGDH